MTAAKLALGILAGIIALLVLSRVVTITAIAPLDFNEGWNAFQAVAARNPAHLYPRNVFIGNNYPPLSFLLITWLGGRSYDFIVIGRLVSLGSILAVTGSICVLVRRLQPSNPFAAPTAALIFLAFGATVFRAYLAMDDPQWLGEALVTTGLLPLLWREPAPRLARWHVVCAALLMCAGGMTKHNIVGLPVAATLWLALYDKRALITWVVTGLSGVAFAVLLDAEVFQHNMIHSILSQPRTYSVSRMLIHGAIALLFVPLLVAGWPLIAHRADDKRYALLIIGTSLSLGIAIFEGSGAGVDINAFFDALIFISVACPIGLAQRSDTGQRLRGIKTAAAPLLVLLPYGMAQAAEEIANKAHAVAATREMTGRLAAARGPAVCEMLALCYWAGKSFQLDFFASGQEIAVSRETRSLRAMLEDRRFAAIEVEAPLGATNLSPLDAMIASTYRPNFSQRSRVLYVPR